MNKAKNKPKVAAAEQSRPAVGRARDLEEDIFDVAHNTMLRSKVVDHSSGHTSSRAALHREWDGGFGGIVPTPESMDKEAKSETEREEVRNAVDATWASAQKMQTLAVATASSASVRLARDQYEAEMKLTLQEQEARLRAEAEEAIGQIWDTANREKVRAVDDALAKYAEEKAAISGTREREKEDLDEAYQALKGEVGRVLEKQHAKNLTDAVNTTWERAAVQEEKAVAQAIERVKEELRKDVEEQLGKERMQLRAEARRTIADHQEELAETTQADKAEIKKLREQLAEARAAAQGAERKAAAEQQKAVRDAVEAVEQIGKASQARAVEAAMAAQPAGMSLGVSIALDGGLVFGAGKAAEAGQTG